MTRRDYKILAKAMAEAYDEVSHEPLALEYGISVAVSKLCDALLVDNAKFDKDKFLAAITAYQCKVTV